MKIGIIGNENITIRCLQHMLNFHDAEIVFVIYDPDKENKPGTIQKICDQNSIRSFKAKAINTHELIERIKGLAPDLILSISNYWLMKRELLAIPPQGVVNFHNAPPSMYHGINIPSWVIINGEKEHGVMWHYAEDKLDAGDVIGFKKFALTASETAASLMVKCIQQGIALFEDIFEGILHESIVSFKQGGNVPYYAKKDLPENHGILNFQWKSEKIDRMVRGLNYLPFKNNFCHAVIKTFSGQVVVNQVIPRISDIHAAPGTVVAIGDGCLEIACEDGFIIIANAMNEKNEELDSKDIAQILKIKVGDII